jgi:hypothetical protein
MLALFNCDVAFGIKYMFAVFNEFEGERTPQTSVCVCVSVSLSVHALCSMNLRGNVHLRQVFVFVSVSLCQCTRPTCAPTQPHTLSPGGEGDRRNEIAVQGRREEEMVTAWFRV